MQTEPEPIPTPQTIAPLPLPVPDNQQLLAPVWHTAGLILLMLANSYFTASFMASHQGRRAAGAGPRSWDYLFTIGFELFLLLLVWIGLRMKKRTLRELIGGRWKTAEDFLIDVGIALGFWVLSAFILVGLAYALGQVNAAGINDMKQRLGGLIPRSGAELTVWVSLSITAGFVEEIIFRGYLQRQLGLLTRNPVIGLILSALIFGLGHGYEGTRNMIRIFAFGMLFGILAHWRKSLRPGMIAHAWQDGLVGVATYFMSKSKMF